MMLGHQTGGKTFGLHKIDNLMNKSQTKNIWSKNTLPAKNVDAFVKAASRESQTKLKELRKIIKSVAPKSEELISYKMPTYKFNSKYLVGFAWFKHHIGFYPMNGTFVQKHKRKLGKFKSAKGSVQFPLNKPLPVALIKKFVKLRMEEIEGVVKKGTNKKHVHNHSDGSIWAKGTLKNDKMEGHWEWFRKTGSKMRSGYFKNGKQAGKWTTYDKLGKVVKVTHFT